ncbi:cysteine/serine-rich nuclear protein 1 [Phlebotomus papatasi]|uniref:Cysteine/serine-rich nuclear protein N-terminal domain-containing protein n=1 Tax=Phlebotomus papatasi TaxID=29031 RepID=A0A1B0D1E7_PHLPP|nr:cysteine/serine-rich nuclear protein 1 [Phlebotomus papatasi]
MLKPIKSFLTYLSVFGTSVNMDECDDETPIETEKVIEYEDIGEDPLSDPLALDESSHSGRGAQNCTVTIPVVEEEEEEKDVVEVAKETVDQQQQEEDNILFVDIEEIQNAGCEEQTLPEEEPVVNSGQEDIEARSEGSDSGLGPESAANPALVQPPQPQRSALKRRSSEAADGAKRCRRSIQFEKVTVYYFPRTQGFVCVPSQGGCTLGMSFNHSDVRTFSLSEAAEQRRMQHQQRLQELNQRQSSSDDTDSDDEPSESASDADTESYGLLQTVTMKQRRALLKASGVQNIDPIEKKECSLIRTSRESCGCNCRGYCDPETCSCSESGIRCQVDRPNFPCGCTRGGCANPMGRIEFNPERVREHFNDTIMMLELEREELGGGQEEAGTSEWLPQLSEVPTETDALDYYGKEQYIIPPTLPSSLDLQYRDGIGEFLEEQQLYNFDQSTVPKLPIPCYNSNYLPQPEYHLPTNSYASPPLLMPSLYEERYPDFSTAPSLTSHPSTIVSHLPQQPEDTSSGTTPPI